jgi:hypothetical protein
MESFNNETNQLYVVLATNGYFAICDNRQQACSIATGIGAVECTIREVANVDEANQWLQFYRLGIYRRATMPADYKQGLRNEVKNASAFKGVNDYLKLSSLETRETINIPSKNEVKVLGHGGTEK